MDRLEVSAVVPAPPGDVYRTWLDPESHAAMTGAAAGGSAALGGTFTAWDGYITARSLELVPGRRIVQAWRTADFGATDADSRLEVVFEAEGNGTRVTVTHTEIPAGQGVNYEQGWKDFYFTPMQTHFGG